MGTVKYVPGFLDIYSMSSMVISMGVQLKSFHYLRSSPCVEKKRVFRFLAGVLIQTTAYLDFIRFVLEDTWDEKQNRP